MQQNYQTTLAPTVAANVGPGYPPNASWGDVNNILTDDSNYAFIGFFEGGQDGDTLVASSFGANLPPGAVIDGIALNIRGLNVGSFGSISIGITGTDSVSVGTLNTTYGGNNDLWGAAQITRDDLDDLQISIAVADVSGGDGIAQVEYLDVVIYWHLDPVVDPVDVPTRVAHKVYSRDGVYLGELPNVSSRLAFVQDENSTGSVLEIVCAQDLRNVTEVTPLLTEDDLDILTEDDLTIYAEVTDLLVTTGNSPDDALFKNSNRIKSYIYNYWYPNGKLMFSGQINRISFSYGNAAEAVNIRVFSDGFDLANYIARGYPFNYTTDVTQSSQNGYVTVIGYSYGAWERYGQTWRTGGSASNLGQLVLKLQGTADVTVSVYDGPNGNFIGSVTKSVSAGSATDINFDFAQLLDTDVSTDYFFGISVPNGQSIKVYRHSTSSTYANGSMYQSSYSGGSGGGSWGAVSGDLYFITKYGTPTTTTTYSSDDPTTDMMSGILADYNDRGGYITERDFDATGLSLTYTFNQANIYDAMKKVLELCPTGFYSYVDLGTAEMDIKQVGSVADFSVVRGRDIQSLDIALTIEQVKNYLLFTGGDTGGGTNLYRDYKDAESSGFYGLRTVPQSDNRVTVGATADAIGDTFIAENADEAHETQITVFNKDMDITLLTPGKTIGFKNFGNFIDSLALQIVRREYNPDSVTLTLGRLPVMLSSEVQRINRELLNEQTANNPSAPS